MKFRDCPTNTPFRIIGNAMAKGRIFILKRRRESAYGIQNVEKVEDDLGEDWVVGPDEEVELVPAK